MAHLGFSCLESKFSRLCNIAFALQSSRHFHPLELGFFKACPTSPSALTETLCLQAFWVKNWISAMGIYHVESNCEGERDKRGRQRFSKLGWVLLFSPYEPEHSAPHRGSMRNALVKAQEVTGYLSLADGCFSLSDGVQLVVIIWVPVITLSLCHLS